MKKLLFFLSALSFTLSAVDLTITPRSPWKASGKKEYSVDFDGGTGIFAHNYMVADFKLHLYLFTVCKSAGTDSKNLGDFRFILCVCGKDKPALGLFFAFDHFNYDSVAQWY